MIMLIVLRCSLIAFWGMEEGWLPSPCGVVLLQL